MVGKILKETIRIGIAFATGLSTGLFGALLGFDLRTVQVVAVVVALLVYTLLGGVKKSA